MPHASEAVFANDPLRFRGGVLVRVVHPGAVNHDDLVSVLLNGAGVAQVGNNRLALGLACEPHAFFAGNRFYTTDANRIAAEHFPMDITCEEVIASCRSSLSAAAPEPPRG